MTSSPKAMAIKINPRYRRILFAVVMSGCTALIVSGVIILLQTESLSAFLHAWVTGFVTAWPIVFISILTLAPMLNRFLDKFFDTP